MESKYDFKRDLENTKYEKVFADWLRKGNPNAVVEEVEGYFPDYDIKMGDVTFEVKRDYWYLQTKNLLVEYMYNKEQEKAGWIKYSKADYLVVFVSDTKFYVVQMEGVRIKFGFEPELWEKKEIVQKEGFTTVNYVAKLNEFVGVKWYEV